MLQNRKQLLGLGISGCLGIIVLAGVLIPSPPASAAAPLPVAPPVLPQGGSDLLNQILQVARDARNAARDGAESAGEIRDRVRTGVNALSDQIRGAIQEATEDIGRELAEQLDGRDEFLNGGGVESFRADLIALLSGFESLQNGLSSLAGGPSDMVSLARLIDVVQALPGRALFPLYRVLAGDNGILSSGIVEQLTEAGAHLEVLAQILQEPDGRSFALDPCDYIDRNPVLARRATYAIQLLGVSLAGVGGILNLVGQKQLVEAQVHGYPGIVIENSLALKLGTGCSIAGDLVFWLANYSWSKIRFCHVEGRFDQVDGGISALLGGQAAIAGDMARLATLDSQLQIIANQLEIKALLEDLLRRLNPRAP